MGFPGGLVGKEPTCQSRMHKRCGFDPWVKKICWRRVWQPTPVFLPGKSHGQRSLVGYSPRGRKESDNWSDCAHTPQKCNVSVPISQFFPPRILNIVAVPRTFAHHRCKMVLNCPLVTLVSWLILKGSRRSRHVLRSWQKRSVTLLGSQKCGQSNWPQCSSVCLRTRWGVKGTGRGERSLAHSLENFNLMPHQDSGIMYQRNQFLSSQIVLIGVVVQMLGSPKINQTPR